MCKRFRCLAKIKILCLSWNSVCSVICSYSTVTNSPQEISCALSTVVQRPVVSFQSTVCAKILKPLRCSHVLQRLKMSDFHTSAVQSLFSHRPKFSINPTWTSNHPRHPGLKATGLDVTSTKKGGVTNPVLTNPKEIGMEVLHLCK